MLSFFSDLLISQITFIESGGYEVLSSIKLASLVGVNGYPVTVETDIHSGMPDFRIVGLADTTIRESYSRVKPAVQDSVSLTGR